MSDAKAFELGIKYVRSVAGGVHPHPHEGGGGVSAASEVLAGTCAEAEAGCALAKAFAIGSVVIEVVVVDHMGGLFARHCCAGFAQGKRRKPRIPALNIGELEDLAALGRHIAALGARWSLRKRWAIWRCDSVAAGFCRRFKLCGRNEGRDRGQASSWGGGDSKVRRTRATQVEETHTNDGN